MEAFFAKAISGLTELWRETLGDSNICIAVLDGLVDLTHPTLATSNLTHLESLVLRTATQGAAIEHGTHVASIIFGQHDSAINGLAPHCRGLIVPIFREAADGSIVPCSQLDLARAITQAVEQGAHIINISGGEFSPSGMAHPILADAVRECAEKGVLIIAATGNQGCKCLNIPGALPSVLAVGAMDAQGVPLEFSNWGEVYETQGILALGEDIPGASPGGSVFMYTGTSYATAVVSGVAGLLLSLQRKHNQRPDPLAVRSAILTSATPCDDERAPDCHRLLAGRLNIRGAMALVLESEELEMSDRNEIFEGNDKPTIISANAAEIIPAHVSQPASVSQIMPADCACGGKGQEGCNCGKSTQMQQVFALGKLSYDFGSSAHHDSIQQDAGANVNLYDHAQFLSYLEANPWVAANVIWTLNLETTPIYAIMPQGAYAREIYDRLRQFLREQLTEGVERISLPGVIIGQAGLISGQIVPVVAPEMRCMYSWTTKALGQLVTGSTPEANTPKKEKSDYAAKVEGVTNFVNRIYFEFRNLGQTSAHRALNYAGVNLARTSDIFSSAATAALELDSIEVEPSPICPPGSDCWDVKLSFFNVNNERASKRVYQITVNVANVCPTLIGQTRSWFVR